MPLDDVFTKTRPKGGEILKSLYECQRLLPLFGAQWSQEQLPALFNAHLCMTILFRKSLYYNSGPCDFFTPTFPEQMLPCFTLSQPQPRVIVWNCIWHSLTTTEQLFSFTKSSLDVNYVPTFFRRYYLVSILLTSNRKRYKDFQHFKQALQSWKFLLSHSKTKQTNMKKKKNTNLSSLC